MARQDWIDLCDSMMDSFGDVVRSVQCVSVVNGAYNPTTGGLSKTETTIDSKFVFTGKNKRVIKDENSYLHTDRFGMLRGSDFTSNDVLPGSKVIIDGSTYQVMESAPDEVGTGAYIEVRLRR